MQQLSAHEQLMYGVHHTRAISTPSNLPTWSWAIDRDDTNWISHVDKQLAGSRYCGVEFLVHRYVKQAATTMMEILSEEESREVIARMQSPFTKYSDDISPCPESGQNVLLIHNAGQQYCLGQGHDIPEPKANEILVKVLAIGLNPVDWKGPEYNFGLPSLPWINGRDYAGVVVQAPKHLHRIRIGDIILSPSTDYRDIRRAAFQEYAVSTEHNCARIPRNVSVQTGAAIGVAYVAAALGLGVCLGIDFSYSQIPGPDLLARVRGLKPDDLPDDIRDECLEGISMTGRASAGDWIAVWGGLMAIQLARLAGLRTIGVADVSKHGEQLLQAGVDLLVDRLDESRAVEIVRGVTNGRLRFALDAVGAKSAEILQSCLSHDPETKTHIVGLSGTPKTSTGNVTQHKVPIKAFHMFHDIGEALMVWAEKLLLNDRVKWPSIHVAHGGFEGINTALDTLKGGIVSGKRIVVPVEQISAAS